MLRLVFQKEKVPKWGIASVENENTREIWRLFPNFNDAFGVGRHEQVGLNEQEVREKADVMSCGLKN